MKTFILSAVTLLSAFDLSEAAPHPRAVCTNPKIRKEWSALTSSERSSYIAAVKCLATKPSKQGLTTPLYDDFTNVHEFHNARIHGYPLFLPWHRYFINLYEKELNSCGYTGGLPYWNWEAASQAGNVTQAAIFNPTTGFGGDGKRTADPQALDACVLTGPFTSLRPNYFQFQTRPHCINRQFTRSGANGQRDVNAQLYNTQVMNSVRANTVFLTFRPALEEPHGAVHTGVGGDMLELTASPNDPLFFLHHAQVDRVWWLWQQQNPAARNYDYAGTEYANQPANLDVVVAMKDFAPEKVVRDFMITNGTELCYRYQ